MLTLLWLRWKLFPMPFRLSSDCGWQDQDFFFFTLLDLTSKFTAHHKENVKLCKCETTFFIHTYSFTLKRNIETLYSNDGSTSKCLVDTTSFFELWKRTVLWKDVPPFSLRTEPSSLTLWKIPQILYCEHNHRAESLQESINDCISCERVFFCLCLTDFNVYIL